MRTVFEAGLPFWKGNLHLHTTESDGRATVEEAIALYKENGYDFLAITDHRKMSRGYEDEDILVIPSAEYDHNYLEKGGPEHAYHITAVGLREDIPWNQNVSPQWMVDRIKEQGAFCTLAHPSWSLMTFEECMSLQDYDAIEVYNSMSDYYDGRPYSDYFVDMLASRGVDKLMTAVDDTHFYKKEACKGYVMVQAKERTWPCLKEALLSGRFYASQGPEFCQITVSEEGVRVETSEVSLIRFLSNTLYDSHREFYAPDGETLQEAFYPWGADDRFVRAEIRDAEGRRAWSNLIRRRYA